MPSVVHELSENNFFGVHCDFFKIIKHISRYNVNLGDMLTYSAFYYVNLLFSSSLQVTLVSKTAPRAHPGWAFFRGCNICTGSGFS